MTLDEFYYWIKGFSELATDVALTAHQVQIIKNHANLCAEVEGKLPKAIHNFVENCQEGQPIPLLTV